VTWAEDRATLGSDPSADPRAKTEGRAITSVARPFQPSARLSQPFGIRIKAINPRGEKPRNTLAESGGEHVDLRGWRIPFQGEALQQLTGAEQYQRWVEKLCELGLLGLTP
jgi:hypothetical protein